MDASLSDVWAVLDDFGEVWKYNPNVESSGIVDGPATGVGATRECHFADGGRIEERIVDYDSQSGYTVDFVDLGGMPLKTNRVEISVSSVDDATTAVTMRATFTPKYGPLGWVMAKVMMESKFAETFEEVLGGLDSYVTDSRARGGTTDVAEAAD